MELAPLIIDLKEDQMHHVEVLVDHFLHTDEWFIGNKTGDCVIMLGYASLYNHDDNNNVEWNFIKEDVLHVKVIRPIKAGTEIFTSYGQLYWKNKMHIKYKGNSESK
jgi:SET domain-containing protein